MLLVAGMMNLPLMAANEKPLGMVVLATNAHLDSADAAMGANVYAGDALDTASGGTLRLKVGTGQIYLMSESAAQFLPGESGAHAKLLRGTIGFSAAASDGIVIETPVGIVRAADGQRAFGQVMLTGPREIIVTSYTGALVVERDGEEHVINEGKTFEVSLPPDPAPQKYGVTPAFNDKLLLKALVVGGVAVVGLFVWCVESESNYQPPCH
jgi:ferric-dicitrate binding protein FerR (iron transport regulator)